MHALVLFSSSRPCLVAVVNALNSNIWIRVAHVLQQRIVLLADERLAMMARNVVPVNAIVVEVVQHGQAVLVGTALLQFAIVWLRLANAAICRPIVLVAIVGGRKFLQFSGPEPAVDGNRLQIGTIAALEVTNAAGGPNVLDLLWPRERVQKRKEKIIMTNRNRAQNTKSARLTNCL